MTLEKTENVSNYYAVEHAQKPSSKLNNLDSASPIVSNLKEEKAMGLSILNDKDFLNLQNPLNTGNPIPLIVEDLTEQKTTLCQKIAAVFDSFTQTIARLWENFKNLF
jgi:hypothetical protein